jgi:hypothetical protein
MSAKQGSSKKAHDPTVVDEKGYATPHKTSCVTIQVTSSCPEKLHLLG